MARFFVACWINDYLRPYDLIDPTLNFIAACWRFFFTIKEIFAAGF
jgi:hypothetical protein